jgi:hypothetical protein
MDLIDRYLHAVKGHLPAAQQDVVAELEDDLRSRVAASEEALGRRLTDDEVADILKSLGRPMVFASRYQKHQALIGPAMLPYYMLTLKVGIGIALLVNVVVAVVLLAAGNPVGESLRGLFKFPFTSLPIQVGWITVVFALLDRYVTAKPFHDSWNPKSLPPVKHARPGASRTSIVGDIVGLGIALAWWIAAFHVPFLVMGPLAAFLKPGPGWAGGYVPVAGLMALAIGGHAIALVRPVWRMPTRIAGHLLALTGIAVLWLGGDLVVPTDVAAPAQLARVLEIVQRCASGALGLVGALTLIELGRDLWKVRRAKRAAALAAVLALAVSGCVPRPHPMSPGIVERLQPRSSTFAVFGSRIDATSTASITSAEASTSRPEV